MRLCSVVLTSLAVLVSASAWAQQDPGNRGASGTGPSAGNAQTGGTGTVQSSGNNNNNVGGNQYNNSTVNNVKGNQTNIKGDQNNYGDQPAKKKNE